MSELYRFDRRSAGTGRSGSLLPVLLSKANRSRPQSAGPPRPNGGTIRHRRKSAGRARAESEILSPRIPLSDLRRRDTGRVQRDRDQEILSRLRHAFFGHRRVVRTKTSAAAAGADALMDRPGDPSPSGAVPRKERDARGLRGLPARRLEGVGTGSLARAERGRRHGRLSRLPFDSVYRKIPGRFQGPMSGLRVPL